MNPEETEGRSEEGRSDETAWQAIVANFGDRATLDDDLSERVEPAAPTYDGSADEEPDWFDASEPGFVPPTPPPLPRATPDRMAAWLGLFGSPTVLLLCMVTGTSIPSLLGWLLVGGFVGGFGYLLATTPGEPRDPWDDGAQI